MYLDAENDLKPKNGILEPEMMCLDPQNDAFSPAK